MNLLKTKNSETREIFKLNHDFNKSFIRIKQTLGGVWYENF